MIVPAAYVLKAPEDRREILLGPAYHTPEYYAAHWREFWTAGESVAEPVPSFEHSRRAPLIVFACFDDGMITHVADGRKGASAGTGLVRLNMSSFQPLVPPIPFQDVVDLIPKRFARHVMDRLSNGGKLPPKSLGVFIDAILALNPGLSARLERFSERRAEGLRNLSHRERVNLAQQKENLATALDIAGIGSRDVLAWSPTMGETRSFLEGIPQAYLREDAVLISDFSDMPGFATVNKYPFAAREFRATDNPDIRLKVIMANRLPLEEQTGADLIYYNEAFKSFVMVQYKSMNHDNKHGATFRWSANDKLAQEISRMDELLQILGAEQHDPSPISFRLHSNPFFLKLCPRLIFNPDDEGLSKGMYFPLDFWKTLAADPVTKGPRDGRVITYGNVGRRLNNTQFISLVAEAWVGTTVPQSAVLERVIEAVIETGKTVTLAVKKAIPLRAAQIAGEDEVGEDDADESVDVTDSL